LGYRGKTDDALAPAEEPGLPNGPRAPTPLLQFGRLACPPSSPGPHGIA